MATPPTSFRVATVAGLALLARGPVATASPPLPVAPTATAAPLGPASPPGPLARFATPAPASPPVVTAAPTAARVVRRRRERITAQMRAIRAANAAALSYPRANAFLNAGLIYDFEVGRLYRIDASPRFLTTIILRRGEHLISKAAGDTVRWTVGETTQGAGDAAQVEVVLKPVRGGQRTNLVLTTDQRTYLLEAVSHDEPIYTSAISWNYPIDDVRDAQAAAARAKLAADAAAVAAAAQAIPIVETALPIDHLNFGYRIDHLKSKHAPPWEPARVFDDGAKTYLQFPPSMGVTAAPPLFLIGPKGQAELVNYRVKGAYYIVDRLIDVAELRLGEKPQTVVRITRTGGAG